MPWDETTRMDQRARFIEDFSTCWYTMSELCELYGISRKTGYKWTQRYAEEGETGLLDRSRAPRQSPQRTEVRCEEALVEERRAHPDWGARKLLLRLRARHFGWAWPAASTAGEILRRYGLVQPRRRRRDSPASGKPLVEATVPNRLWTADFKGEFRTGDHQICYPLTVADRFSRYLLGCRSRRSTAMSEARPVFEELFVDYGLPDAILTDGGPPFASAASPRRLSRLSVWWVKLGIQPVLIQPGKPQQNGCHERMHRTLKAATARPPASTWAAQQHAFDRFRREYNDERPHEGIGMRMPSQLYRPSVRPFPSKLGELSYPGHFEVRRVRASGEIKWRSQRLFLSEVLEGELVGLEESDDGLWSLYIGPLLLGRYDEREQDLDLL
jgi:transposase InsO family protein